MKAIRTSFSGHDGRINAVAFSEDGVFLLSAGDDGVLKVWDHRTQEAVSTFRVDDERLSDCAISRDGRLLVASGTEKLWIWERSRHDFPRALAGHTDRVTGCALSPDERWVASSSDDATLKVWDCAGARVLRTLHGHVAGVSDCAVGADGRLLVSAGKDEVLKLWDPTSGEELRSLRGHDGRVNACAVSPDGSSVVSAGHDGILKLWDADSGRDLGSLEGHLGPVWDCAVSPDARFIVSASDDGTLRIWDSATLTELATLRGSLCCAVGAGGELIAAGTDDGTLEIWNLDGPVVTGAELHSVQAPSAPEAMATAPRARYLDENVQFTVYRPHAIVPDVWHDLLVFAHLSELPPGAAESEPDPVAEVERRARQKLGEDLSGHVSLTQDSVDAVPHAGELTFMPEVEGIEFNPPHRTFLWLESVHGEDFRLRAGSDVDGQTLRGRLSVFLGAAILLADVPLALRVDSGFVAREPMAVERARSYRKIFPSYSHSDSWVVDEFERHARALGDDYLRDVVALRAGEVWDPRLAELIAEADVFQLFWSWNSIDSSYVQSEWKHALTLARPNFIRPVYWDEPMPVREERDLPPYALKRIHFQHIRPKRPPDAQAVTAAQPPPEAMQPTREQYMERTSRMETRELALETRRSPLLLFAAVVAVAVIVLLVFGYWDAWL